MDEPPISPELAPKPTPKPWFRAKRIGYGTGLPIAWQGWVMLLVHCAVIIGLALAFMSAATWVKALVLTVAALLPMPLYRAKTEGNGQLR